MVLIRVFSIGIASVSRGHSAQLQSTTGEVNSGRTIPGQNTAVSLKGDKNLKIPLNYQRSEYDCVPTTFLNALSYLCDREEIDPVIIKAIYRHSLDSRDSHGNPGKRGTSEQAVKSLAIWVNEYSRKIGLGIHCKFLSTKKITLESSLITTRVNLGGVLLACIHFAGSYHYVLVTGLDEHFAYVFDPYYRTVNSEEQEFDFITSQPLNMNRRVRKEVFFGVESQPYALGEVSKREGVLMYREKTGGAG